LKGHCNRIDDDMTLPQVTPYGLPDKRRFQRVAVSLAGRYMLESRQEHACRTIDMSPGGMLLSAPVRPDIGERVVVYLDALGRFAGRAVRAVPEGFSMTIDLSPGKRERLADQLTWFANRLEAGLPEDRRHERVTPLMQRAILRLPNGDEQFVKILDLSISGVGVETNCVPALGTPVTIGATPLVVIRHFDAGFAGEFITPFAEGEVDELTRL